MSNITSKTLTIYEIISENKQIKIPFFQRQYVWNYDEQISQLIDDVERNKDISYFLGVVTFRCDFDGKWIIIDGQQRLTTIFLISKVISEHKLIDKDLKQKLDQIINGLNFENFNVKNRDIFINIINSNKLSDNEDKNSSYFTNYLKIKKHLDKYDEKQINNFYDKLFNKTCVVSIFLPMEINENIVFSKMNSTGVELTAFDMFRNDILSSLIDEDRNINNLSDRAINKNIENNIKLINDVSSYLTKKSKDNTNALLRSFIAYKTYRLVNENSKSIFSSYLELKKKYEKASDLFNEFIEFAVYYKFYFNFEYENYFNNHELIIIEQKFSTYITLLISTIKEYAIINSNYNLEIVNLDELLNCWKIIEWYIISREFVSRGDRTITRTVPRFVSDINESYENTNLSYTEKLYDVLIHRPLLKSKDEDLGCRIPNNSELEKGFVETRIYSENRKFTKGFLIRLITIFKQQNKSKLEFEFSKSTIEHVWPRDDSKWIDKKNDISNIEIDSFKDTIGNLTLTAYNSEYSNESFYEKQKLMNDKEEFKFNTSYFVDKVNDWNVAEIKYRAKYLLNNLVKPFWNFDNLIKKELDDSKINLFSIKNEKLKQGVLDSGFNEELTFETIHEIASLYINDGLNYYQIAEKIFNNNLFNNVVESIIEYLDLSENKNIDFNQWIKNHEYKIKQLVDDIQQIKLENDEIINNQQNINSKNKLPKFDWFLEHGLLEKGEEIYIKGSPNKKAYVVDGKNVRYNGKIMSYNAFAI